MAKSIPAPESTVLDALLQDAAPTWHALRDLVDETYDIAQEWGGKSKYGEYELRWRRGGKTLATAYFHPGKLVCQIVFGQAERDKVEALQPPLSGELRRCYDEATTFHDGKWVGFELPSTEAAQALRPLLLVKRRPNKGASAR